MNARRKSACRAAAVLLLALASSAAPASADTAVKLLGPQTARTAAGKAISQLPATQPFSGDSTVLPLLGASAGRLHVRLPGNGNPTGWIDAQNTVLLSTHYRLSVSRKARTATLTRDGSPAGRFRVVVGKPATPTPAGEFYIAESVQQSPGSELGPWALSTSGIGRASQLGLGLHVALHGANELGDPLGSAKSHGCVRFADNVIRRLARLLTPGSLITIR